MKRAFATWFAGGLLLGAALVPASARASGFSWLRSENKNVREGNARLKAGDSKAALSAYDRAARELPAEAAVQLDRGIALLRANQLGPARDALRAATQAPAGLPIRADAYYDLGIGFYREADARAGEGKHDEAQKMFREAAEAFKHALRARASDHDAAYNYELAKRRIQEQEQKQKEKEKEKQADDEQKKKQQQSKDQDQQQDASQDDKSKSDDTPKPDDKPKSEPDDKRRPEAQKAQQPKPQPGQQQEQQEPQPQQSAQDNLRPDVARALDALENGQDNLERIRALNRAAREQRRPEKDW